MNGHLLKVLTTVALISAPVGAFHTPRIAARSRNVGFVQSSAYKKNEVVSTGSRHPTQIYASGATDTDFEVDIDAMTKYAVAGAVQMGGFFLLLNAFDQGIAAFDLDVPFWAKCLFFYGCSLKSRVLNPLSNQRPKIADPIQQEINRPGWTPPGLVFPIMWLLIIGPLRAYSSALVVDGAGEFANLATLSFLLHLSVGDIWNTINNVEKRLGAAASGVVLVFLSAANAAYQYYQVDPTAGQLLASTLLWLGTAGALVNSIWQLNPTVSGELDALFPVKGDVETKYAWFDSSE